MNYDEIAKEIGKEMIKYNNDDKSFIELFELCLKKQGSFSERESNKILTKVIHVITVMGYDIDSINPCHFRCFMN